MSSIPPYAVMAAAMALAAPGPSQHIGGPPAKAIPRVERERRKAKKKAAQQSRRRNRK